MKILQGTITSLKTPQTARVHVVRSWQHPIYKKFVKRSKNYMCHYTDLKLVEGDIVEIQECAPISKLKHFKVVTKIAEATAQSLQAAEAVNAKAAKNHKSTTKEKVSKEKSTKETK